MKRTQVLLTEGQQEKIRHIAAAESVSAGAVIRRLIDYALAESERDRMREAAERMREYYSDGSGNGDDAAFRDIDPWSSDEAR